jgi:LacI family transcriptional regulator
MKRLVRVGLLVNHCYSFYRGVLQGIRAFSDLHPDWMFMPLREDRGKLMWYGPEPPDGILASVHTPQLAKAVRNWRGPLVNVSSVLPNLPWPRVVPDGAQIAQMAAEHLLQLGLRNFGFVGHPQHLYSLEREAAFREALKAAGAEVSCFHARPEHRFEPHAEIRSLDRRVEKWLARLPKPAGIMVPTDFWGVELTEACRQLGVLIPDDVAIIGVSNDDLYAEFSRPPLSSIVLPTKRIGYEAAALLDRLLHGNRPPTRPLLFAPTHVHVRRSTDVLAIDDPVVRTAIRLIRERAHTGISVDDIVREVHTSRRPLERRFRRCRGSGVAEEIRRAHLARSQQLLAESDLTMEAVARQSGFESARHMAAVYRRELQIAPSEYRRTSRPFPAAMTE